MDGQPIHNQSIWRGRVMAALNINSLLAHKWWWCLYVFTEYKNIKNYHIRDDLCDGQLECLVIEIIRPHCRPFFVSTWYKPPNSAQDVFKQFESLVDKVDSKQKDFYLFTFWVI